MTAVSFFVGKGGVGKTTLASAYAAWRAERGPVLLLSTDPAHSLADIFEIRLGAARRKLTACPRGERGARAEGRRRRLSSLTLWQIDAAQQFRKFLARHRDAILSLVESGTMFTREEIEPLLDETIPGMAEVAALLTISELLQRGGYAEIVVDTAPIGHTLRLLQMPEHFLRFLRFLEIAASRDQLLAERFGGRSTPTASAHPFLAEWRRAVEAVHDALTRPQSRLVLVTTPEDFALQESVRVAATMRQSSPPLRIREIVLNRVVTRAGGCHECSARSAEARRAAQFLRRHFRSIPQRVAEDDGSPVMGAARLRAFGAHVFAGGALPKAASPPRAASVNLAAGRPRPAGSRLPLERQGWPLLDVPLSLSIGKGGVGKTTVSAALAYHTRAAEPKTTISICSVDPAPSLDDVFRQPVGDNLAPVLGDRHLLAMEVDAAARFREFADRAQRKLADSLQVSSGGVHVELSFERQVIGALLDMTPPGLDELAATLSILDLLEQGSGRVMIDLAPTGHALELLRMPQRILHWSRLLLKTLAPHRTLALVQDVAVEIATLEQRVRGLAQALRNPKGARVWPVMLAEPLPDRETERLLRALDELGAPRGALFVNRVRLDDPGRCARCRRRKEWQAAALAGLRRKYRGAIYCLPERPRGIAGAAELKAFTRNLWQLPPKSRRG
ncbi:MAG TPA: ArsA family ATPase [Terriglobales bacterium]|nr:ArsA family ATPase [Terriglobales bacterium]